MANKAIVDYKTMHLRILFGLLIGYPVVIATVVMLHYVLPLPDSPTQHQGPVSVNGSVPLGSIVAWIPSPNRDHQEPVPHGWQLCDGSEITEETSPWKGQNSPNLTNRFLRGGDMKNFLTLQEDQIQDHEHVDGGHTHTDKGHTHADSGHTHTDAGHTHSYSDNALWSRGNVADGRYWTSGDKVRATQTGKANIQSAKANIGSSKAIIENSSSNIQGVHAGTRSARVGDETRPKAAYIMWIIKVVE